MGRLDDVLAVQGDRKRLGSEAVAVADRTDRFLHELSHPDLDLHALRLAVTPPHLLEQAGIGFVDRLLAVFVDVVHRNRFLGAVEDFLDDFLRQLVEGSVQREMVGGGQCLEGDAGPGGIRIVCHHSPLVEGQAVIGNQQVRVELRLDTQTVALGTCSVGIVEGEKPGFDLGKGDAAKRAAVLLAENLFGLISVGADESDLHQAARHLVTGLDRVGKPLPVLLADDQTVHHHVDCVLDLLLQLGNIVDQVHRPIHLDPLIPRFLRIIKDLLVLALAPDGDRGADHDSGPFAMGEHDIDDLVHRHLADLPSTTRAMGDATARPEQAVIVIDLGDGTHRGTRVLMGRFLLDGDCRLQPFHVVDIRLFHPPKEHARIGGKAFHIPSLSFGEDGVEGKTALARSGEAADDDQLVFLQRQVDILQIVLAGTFDDQLVLHR